MGVKIRQKKKGKGNPWWVFITHNKQRTSILCLGHITCISGEPEKGIMLMNKGFRLNPLSQFHYYSNLGDAYMMNGQYEKAIEVLNQGIMIQPEALNPYIYLAGCYIMLNEFNKAKKAEKKILEIDPNFSFKHFKSNLRKKDQIKLKRVSNITAKLGFRNKLVLLYCMLFCCLKCGDLSNESQFLDVYRFFSISPP
jgi:tetratricopeptide (TPR) repeat protein